MAKDAHMGGYLDVDESREINFYAPMHLCFLFVYVSVVISIGEVPCFVCMQFGPTLSTSLCHDVVISRVDCILKY